MRFSIKAKLLASVACIVSLALLASGGFAYSYFYQILKTRTMNDEAIKLDQTAGRLLYIQEDIRQFAQYILIDGEIRSRIKAIYDNDPYTRLSGESWLSEKLNGYLLLRNHIDSVVLVSRDGRIVSTNPAANLYYGTTLDESWYRHFLARNVRAGFTEVHSLASQPVPKPTISYVVRFNPLLDKESRLDYLIVHVNLDYLEAVLPEDRGGYDAYLLLDAAQHVLLGTGEAALPEPVSGAGAHQTERGAAIVTVNGKMSDGWTLVTGMPKGPLLADINAIMYVFALSIALTLLVVIAALTPLVHSMTRPISRLAQAMKLVAIGRLNTSVDIRSGDEIQLLGEGFNRMLSELRTHIRKAVDDEQIKQKLRFELLLSQVNPHFIYNTLNTVIYMARKADAPDIARMTESFIRLLQETVLVEGDRHLAAIGEELDSVRDYLVIQNYRYPDRFRVEWDIASPLLACEIPRTLLQPLIENALYHGIVPKAEQGTISVRIKEAAGCLRIEVADDGVGLSAEQIRRFEEGQDMRDASPRMRPIGLANVRERLRSYYGPAAAMRIDSPKEGGTTIVMDLPLRETSGYHPK